MIDYLEEILRQVEEEDEGEESAALAGPGEKRFGAVIFGDAADTGAAGDTGSPEEMPARTDTPYGAVAAEGAVEWQSGVAVSDRAAVETEAAAEAGSLEEGSARAAAPYGAMATEDVVEWQSGIAVLDGAAVETGMAGEATRLAERRTGAAPRYGVVNLEQDAGWVEDASGGGPYRELWRSGAAEIGGHSGIESGAAGIYAGLTRSRTAAGAVGRRETVTVTVPAAEREQSIQAGMGAAELDRCFQRDARRYDGGFTLF